MSTPWSAIVWCRHFWWTHLAGRHCSIRGSNTFVPFLLRSLTRSRHEQGTPWQWTLWRKQLRCSTEYSIPINRLSNATSITLRTNAALDSNKYVEQHSVAVRPADRGRWTPTMTTCRGQMQLRVQLLSLVVSRYAVIDVVSFRIAPWRHRLAVCDGRLEPCETIAQNLK